MKNITLKCVSKCRELGFGYAGTQGGQWCFCGNSYGRTGETDRCNNPCAGDSGQTCGGYFANSVWSVGK